jgi:hypothetical protein
VNEIFARFGSFDLAVISVQRSSTAEQLTSERVGGSRIWQRVNQSNNPRAEFKQSIF